MTNAKGVLEWMAWKEKREREMTHEEWFDSLTTNEKAYHLADICAWAMEEFRCGKTEKANTGYWREWLKKKHNEMY